MTMDPDGVGGLETRVDEAVADYLRAVEAGLAPDRGQFLARHPDLAADLAEFFADRDRIENWVKTTAIGPAEPSTCPHCHGPLEPGAAQVICSGCGARFRLERAAAGLPHPDRIGRFELLAVVGQGGFGVVYRAWDSELRRAVALKVPRPGTVVDD